MKIIYYDSSLLYLQAFLALSLYLYLYIYQHWNYYVFNMRCAQDVNEAQYLLMESIAKVTLDLTCFLS